MRADASASRQMTRVADGDLDAHAGIGTVKGAVHLGQHVDARGVGVAHAQVAVLELIQPAQLGVKRVH
jgi:hypothetical protein